MVSAPSNSMATQTALPGGKEVWLGAMVPKRWAKRAVTRNLIKRQIYSVASRYETRLPAAAHLVRLRSGFDRQQFLSAASDQLRNAVRAEIEQLFNKAMSAMHQELA
jgi:ribonuclease P protein component